MNSYKHPNSSKNTIFKSPYGKHSNCSPGYLFSFKFPNNSYEHPNSSIDKIFSSPYGKLRIVYLFSLKFPPYGDELL